MGPHSRPMTSSSSFLHLVDIFFVLVYHCLITANREVKPMWTNKIRDAFDNVRSGSSILECVADKYHALIIHAFSTGDWQGENTVVLARASDRPDRDYEFGLATMSYGSCSFCDVEESLEERYSGLELEKKFREYAADFHVTWYSADDMIKFLDEGADTQAWYYVYSDEDVVNEHVEASKAAVRKFMKVVNAG